MYDRVPSLSHRKLRFPMRQKSSHHRKCVGCRTRLLLCSWQAAELVSKLLLCSWQAAELVSKLLLRSWQAAELVSKLLLCSEQAAQFFSVKEIVREFIVFCPERECLACGCPRAVLRVFSKAGNSCQRGTLCKVQYFSDAVFFGTAAESITAAFAAGADDKSALYQIFYNDFQVFFVYSLPFCHIFQRYRLSVIMFGKVNHDTQRIASFC